MKSGMRNRMKNDNKKSGEGIEGIRSPGNVVSLKGRGEYFSSLSIFLFKKYAHWPRMVRAASEELFLLERDTETWLWGDRI